MAKSAHFCPNWIIGMAITSFMPIPTITMGILEINEYLPTLLLAQTESINILPLLDRHQSRTLHWYYSDTSAMY